MKKHGHHGYREWLERVYAVTAACRNSTGLISGEVMTALQLFILEFGQFNANFTLDELRRLQYPQSPFAVMHRHTYLRATETWAVEILRKRYINERSQQNGPRLYPVFLDSKLFWGELQRYVTIIDEQQFDAAIDIFTTQVWVRLTDPVNKKHVEEQIRKKIEHHLIDQHFEDEDIRRILKKSEHVYSTVEKNLLKQHLAEQLEQARAAYQMAKEQEQKNRDLKRNQAWYGPVFGWLKNDHADFLIKKNIKSPKDLMQFAKQEPGIFEDFYNQMPKQEIDLEEDSFYARAIDRWKTSKASPYLDRFCYFIQTQYMDIETLTLIGHKEAESNDSWGPKSLVNHLGYRLDPVKALRAILGLYNKLFIDQAQTTEFWQELTDTPMAQSLKSLAITDTPETEFDLLASLPQQIFCAPQHSSHTLINLLETREYQYLLRLVEQYKKTPIQDLKDTVSFEIYACFLLNYCRRFQRLYQNNTLMQRVALLEILQSMRLFIAACNSKDMSQAVRAIQTVCEILRLDLAFNPLSEQLLLTEIIRKKLLRSFPVQSVAFTTFGMRSYARVLQLEPTLNNTIEHGPARISVTNQNYFESLVNLGMLHNKKAIVTHFRQLNELDSAADLIFMEIHPNNVTERRQFAQDLLALLRNMATNQWRNKPRTLVIDATLNALDDEEIADALNQAKPLMDDGLFNIILLQSLTKFTQLGVDERSGGIMVILNNNDHYWNPYNMRCKTVLATEPCEMSNLHYFSYFFLQDGLIKNYINLIKLYNMNLYSAITTQLDELDVGTQQRFQLTISSDMRACYVALNMHGLLPAIDAGFNFSSRDIEAFGGDIVDQLLIPLCEFYQLPLTQRMSIGFPLSSVNCVQDSLRFTVGLETSQQRGQYAEIIAFISFVLNRFRNLNLLFEKNTDGVYEKRMQFFAEKVLQFKSMTPGCDQQYMLTFQQQSYDRADSRTVVMRDGELALRRADHGQAQDRIYDNKSICAYVAGHQDAVFLSNILTAKRRMIAACFSHLVSQTEQGVKLVFNDLRNTLTLSFHIINQPQDTRMIYGPFQSNSGHVFFEWKNNHVTGYVKMFSPPAYGNALQIFRIHEQRIFIQKGEMRNKFDMIPLEERVFLFKAAAYETNSGATAFKRFCGFMNFSQQTQFYDCNPSFKYIDCEHQPLLQDPTTITFTRNGSELTIKRDFPCYQGSGITVYKRYFNPENTGVEIDYWQEKDPVLHRFMCFAIAICVNALDQPANKKAGFKARGYYSDAGPLLTHFLFRIPYGAIDGIFARAITLVINHRSDLLQLHEHRTSSNQAVKPGQINNQYRFFSEDYQYYDNTDAYHRDFLDEGNLATEIESELGLRKNNDPK